jgi:hypothetical protein
MSDTTTKPVRIQLKRTKGWRMPENTVKVDRSTQWGNPYIAGETVPVVDDDGFGEVVDNYLIKDVADAIGLYREHMDFKGWTYDLESLRGKNLACWCAIDQPCHADVLLELANAKEPGNG